MTNSTDQSLRESTFDRILIVKPSSLGDVIHAFPVLNGLRTRYPDAQIDWLVNNAFAPLLADHPQINDVIRFDRSAFNRTRSVAESASTLVSLVRKIRQKRYDLVIDLQGLFRSGFFARVTGAPTRIGFADAREGAVHFYTHRIETTDLNTHAVDKNYLVSRPLGFSDVPVEFNLPMTDSDRQSADRLLRESDINPTAPFVALCPGARWETKLWFADRFAKLTDDIQQQLRLPSILLGAADETELCDDIRTRSATRPVVMAGKTGIRELVAIIDRASAVVTLDSAPMHIAAALDRPLVAIVGPTNPNRTGPYQRPDAVIQSKPDCSPCYLKRMRDCQYDHQCMQNVSVSHVLRRLADIVPTATRDRRTDPGVVN
jgi:lipopolysaccharide heptosyltransferase I